MELTDKGYGGWGYGGWGCGYGDGDGEEKTEYLNAILESAKVEDGCVYVFWRSHEDGTPANGGGGGVRKVGMVEEIPGPLEICTRNALHGTKEPQIWKGGRWWIVALYPPVQATRDKVGSLKRRIVKDLGKCPF
jgi:hypothetical protein